MSERQNAEIDATTIGGLIAALAGLPQGHPIFVNNVPPSALSSYRGGGVS